jgi:pantoate--beta-alanine ligase
MELIRIPRIMQDTCRKHLLKGRTLGFVPTMGALHDGHLSLIKRAKMENDVTAVSIFINPLQFGPSEDLARYPRNIDEDRKKIDDLEVDILFLPENSLMYPQGFSTHVNVDALSEKLCGRFRPGHFEGVATVVAKLLNVVSPARAYFGQKDFQQAVIIKRMVRDLNVGLEIVVCPTIREQDGLAMSSRNLYLDEGQRKAAAVLYKCLSQASDAINAGERSPVVIKELMAEVLSAEPLFTQIDYASVYDPETLDEVSRIEGEVLLAMAVILGNTRLIDNMLVNV